MSFSVNTNITSLQAQNNLRASSDFQSKTIGRVTSGLRIVSSGDDAAGLAIANSFRSDQAVLTQGIRNANDGLSTLQTIDGGMNNISQLLDRARTLATQSASGTFTGGATGRAQLNSEFQSVLSEIDRQAKSIGLNQGGELATNLSVFIGGGRGTSATDIIKNGSVSVNLSNSTVDGKSLGLKGVQVTGNTSVDLGSGQSTSVQALITDPTNISSEGTSGYTDFYFSGAGFTDDSKIKVSVNLNGVTDTTTLAAAINTAVQNAGNGTTAAATAFKNANITASVATNNGKQQLSFTSGSGAFQVEAGDRTANALLGNLSGTTGNDLTTKVTAAATKSVVGGTLAAETIRLRVQGAGMTSPANVDISTNGSSDTMATLMTSLSSAVAANSSLKNAGITVDTSGSSIVFKNTRGESFSVEAAGDVNNYLGFGSFQMGASTAVEYNSITAGTSYAVASAATTGVSTLEFSFNGAASGGTASTISSSADVVTSGFATNGAGNTLALTIDGKSFTVDFANDPNKNAAEAGTNIVKYINDQARKALNLDSSVNVASLTGNNLTLTSPTKGSSSSVAITRSTLSDSLGFTSAGDGAIGAGVHNATAGTGADSVSVSLAGGDATGAVLTGAAAAPAGTNIDFTAAPYNVSTVITTDIGTVTITAAMFTSLTATNSGATAAVGLINTQAKLQLGTDSNLASIVNGKIVLTDPTKGKTSSISVANSASADALGLTSGAPNATTGTNATAADVASRFNAQFASHSDLASAGLQATVDTNGKIVLGSSNGTEFRVNASGNNIGFGTTGVAFTGNTNDNAPAISHTLNSQGSVQTGALTFTGLKFGDDDQTITVSANDASGAQQSWDIKLQNDSTTQNGRNIDEAINTINSELQKSNVSVLQGIVAVKTNTGGGEAITFLGADDFKVSIGSNKSGNGFAAQGSTQTASVQGTGSTVSILDSDSATRAVTALAAAVTTLGNAQAAVGKGQNNFNYAVNLAQSQVTNLAAAESRIRDADLAQEAANLSKAQILVQAGTAALAQANSAPQAILSLLRG